MGRFIFSQSYIKLFKEGYKNKENQYFVLLSDKCIPLYNSNIIFDKIIKMNNNILYYWKPKFKDHIIRYNTFNNKNFIEKNEFYFQRQWMILNRNTTKFF